MVYRDAIIFVKQAHVRVSTRHLTPDHNTTAKPGHALARPGHCLEEDAAPSLKVRQHAHVTCSLAQAFITRPQRHTRGHESTRQKCHIDSTETPPP